MNKDIRVLVIGMSGILAGVEREVLGIIAHCPENIHFDFLCFGNRFKYEEILQGNSIFYYIPKRKKNIIKSNMRQRSFWREHGQEYDVIWINTASASNITMYKYAKKYSNARIISHSHNSKIEYSDPVLKAGHSILHLFNRNRLVACSDVLVSCSKSAAIHLYGVINDDVHILYNGIDLKRFQFDSATRKAIREDLCISEDELVLCCVGRVEKVKNFIHSIKVLERLQNKQIKSTLLIVGDGSQSDVLKQYVKQNRINKVLFLGSQSDVKPYLDCADVFLQPSFFEGFPVSTIEAQTNGIKCIISNNITPEVKMTDLVVMLPVDEQYIDDWCTECSNCASAISRGDYTRIMYEQGLDLGTVSKKMQDFFYGNYR